MFFNDVRLQVRNGIYYAYGFVLLIYLTLLYFSGEYLPIWALGLLIYSDPAVLGFFFLGALLILEKSEGTRTALAVTPMPATHYYISKTLSLTLVSLVSAMLIALFAHEHIHWPLYLTTVIFVSVTFISIGFPIALYFKTATSYLMGAAAILAPIMLPMFFALAPSFPIWAFLFPPAVHFRLVLVSLGAFEADLMQISIMLIVTTLTCLLSVGLAINAVTKEFAK